MGKLTRFGVSLDEELLEPFDALCAVKGYSNRSEAIRDLIRKALVAEEWQQADGQGAGTLTLVYDHHKNDLARRLTQMQHDEHDIIIATLHVHLDHHNCLEVLILKGEAARVRALADKLISCKGVKHGTYRTGSRIMEDVQRHAPKVPINIDRVGIRGITVPLLVRDRAQGSRQTVARVDLGVDLPASFKGTHMSRFIEALEEWNDEINYQSVRRLLATVKERLEARRSYVRFCFPYFVHKPAPSSGIKSIISYECRLTGELDEKGQSFLLEVDVPVMTVCPCSKAISREGAHSQRTMIHLAVRMSGFSWIEEFIEMAEASGSSAVYTLLKREDEKYVTEHAFAQPTFVEDVVRNVAQRLTEHEHVRWFRVEVESMESIHSHNAFACIERDLRTQDEQA